MDAEFFRRMAQQCRDLTRRARTETTKTQLRVWAEEFDAHAEVAEMGERNCHDHGCR